MEEKHKTIEAWEKAYKNLNPEQKKAVDSIEGPVMVIAGPGTGKTQILTLRIANILQKTDTKPDQILALTFTESGVHAMKERLRTYTGSLAYKVAIYTFHGFAQHLISSYPDAYIRIIGGRPVTDIEKITYLEQILESKDITLLRPLGNPSYYINALLRMLSTLKQEYITPNSLREIISVQERQLLEIEPIHQKGAHKGKPRSEYQKKEKDIAKNRELLYVYERYEALLVANKVYDFDDMIIETIKALETNETMLLDVQEQYLYLLADEHQDVNGSQNKILSLLASYHKSPNLFVVGDEKQAIFRFQGASLENFLYFEDAYAKTELIALTLNYRSGQAILDAAHSLIAVADGFLSTLRVPLLAHRTNAAQVVKGEYGHQIFEDRSVVLQIKRRIEQGVVPTEIAIIVRTNKEVEYFAQLLKKEGIPVVATADSDILEHPIFRSVMALIDVLVSPEQEASLFTVLHGAYWGISNDDLVRICSLRRYDQSLWSILTNTELQEESGVRSLDKIANLISTITTAQEKMVTELPHVVLEYVLQQSGFLDFVMTSNPLEGGRVIRRLYDEIQEMAIGKDALSFISIKNALALRMEYGLPLRAPFITTHETAVSVLTAHKSKGLEFEEVFIPHATDTSWGEKRDRTTFAVPLTKHIKPETLDESDDERRLFYVALTRAKNNVYISYSKNNQEGKIFEVSRHIEGIDPLLLTEVTDESEADADPLLEITKKIDSVPFSTELLVSVLKKQGLSATSLNNYLQSPYEYLYRNVLRIPEIQSPSLLFGTLIHAVLQKITSVHTKEKRMVTATEVKTFLEQALTKLPLSPVEYTQLHEKALKVVLEYIPHLESSLPLCTKEEFSLKVYMKTGIPEFEEVLLTGKFDRLDFDDAGNVVRVFDYKTGKAKTRNEIEGNTKNADGNYKRQLTFYALLLELYGDERYLCTEGVLSFVEADAKGKIHEEAFVITQAEIDALKAEIIEIVRAISNGAAFKDPCDPQSSQYCHLVSMLENKK